jgi:hypothetical protein
MADSRLEGAPVLRQTNCRVGGHTFVWSGPEERPPWDVRCECWSYSWDDWQAERTKAEGKGDNVAMPPNQRTW